MAARKWSWAVKCSIEVVPPKVKILKRNKNGMKTERKRQQRSRRMTYRGPGAKDQRGIRNKDLPRKAEEEVASTSAPIPDDLQLMTSISSGFSRGWLCGARPEAAHLRAKRSWATARLLPYCLEAE
ncbi:hypothetical protein M9H77_17228 [Catharanthus roseus]|uniref:Uncharacterized protein n=1 Tax=Catharanthus roseus TaxID=4058 RepID=A0ACC0B404_CATRO|nr:hypothetical protein M9H77_17228 [Catharanthus roseus]